MIANAHPVAPEELMALLDGELGSEEARAVSAHLEECAECRRLAEQFRAVSRAMNGWTVEDAPPAPGESLMEEAVRSAGSGKPDVGTRFVLWGMPRWATGGGALVVIVCVLAVSGALIFHGSLAKQQQMVTFVNPQSQPSAGSFSADGQDTANTSSRRAVAELKALPSPAAVAGIVNQETRLAANQALEAAPPPAPVPDGSRRAPASAGAEGKISMNGGGGGQTIGPAATGPMIARTVTLAIVVKDFPAARAALDAILVRHRGYSAQLTANTEENVQRSLQDSLRIPAPELATAMAELKALGRVENESQSGEEVTQQHADLVARLQNSRETEQRMRDILAQRTGKIEDVLQVEEEIARVRGEIEGMEAEQQALEHRVDFASVDLHISEELKEQFRSPSASVGTQVRNAFVTGMRNAAETLLGLMLFIEEAGPEILVWLVLLGTPGYLLWRRYRGVRSRV